MAYVPKMARVTSFTSVASATSVASVATTSSVPAKKACEGVALAPIRMIDLAKGGTAPATPTAAAAKSTYVPPSMRIRAPAPPSRQLSFEDLASAELFPSLAPTPTGTPISGGWSMAQIRSRLTAAAPTPKTVAPVTPALSTVNSFAALDEDATAASATPRSTASNFKLVIEERIRRDEMERLGAHIEDEPTDPKLMSPAQLAKHGWAAIKLPPTDPTERRAWISDYNARIAARDAAALFDETYGIPNYGGGRNIPLALDHASSVPDYPDDDMSVMNMTEEDGLTA